MFWTNNSWAGYKEIIFAMPSLDAITPTIPSLGVFWKFEEVVFCTNSMHIIRTIIATKNCTVFSSSFLGRTGTILRTRALVHRSNLLETNCSTWDPSFLLQRVTGSLAFAFARSQVQYGAGNCKKDDYWFSQTSLCVSFSYLITKTFISEQRFVDSVSKKATAKYNGFYKMRGFYICMDLNNATKFTGSELSDPAEIF